jgi:FkbM family methyltransferase
MTVLSRLRRIANTVGLDISRVRDGHPGYARAQILAFRGVTLVWDVGANDGGYGVELRRFGYDGRIVSFEPTSSAYERLARRIATDGRWTAASIALGDEEGTATINVAGNSAASSSLLPMLDRHLKAAPRSAYVGSETVPVRRLDDLWRDYARPEDTMFLKLDVQGFEGQVLAGAADVVSQCCGIQMELSLVPLYQGALPFREALEWADEAGFTLASLNPGFTDRTTGQMLQADGIFIR